MREYLGPAFAAPQDAGVGQIADDAPNGSVMPILTRPGPIPGLLPFVRMIILIFIQVQFRLIDRIIRTRYKDFFGGSPIWNSRSSSVI